MLEGIAEQKKGIVEHYPTHLLCNDETELYPPSHFK